MKKSLLWLLLFATTMALTGCATTTVNPLTQNEATAVPGLGMNLHAASASDSNVDHVEATLYFRYLDEPMLAPESRTLAVKQDQSIELAIVQALIDGPSAGHSDLRRLLPTNAVVESTASRGDILFVTFDEGFLYDDIPADWQDDSTWREQAPIQRQLAAQSIAASITENYPYTGVQILIHKKNEVQTNLRLENAYFLTGAGGLSEPVARDETLLLTAGNTAGVILTAWQQHDFETLYHYITDADKPTLATVVDQFSQIAALGDFTVSAGSVNADGQLATVTVLLHTIRSGVTAETLRYPLHLMRENGVWKVTYTRLTAMMNR